MKVIDCARGIDIFKALNEEGLEKTSKHLSVRIYAKGEQIIGHGDKTRDVFFVSEGSVRTTIFSVSGREISYQDLGEGDMFGELSALDGEPRSTHVITLSPSTIGSMKHSDFANVMSQYPQVADAVMSRLVGLARFLCNRVFEFGALDVKNRVRAELLRLAKASKNGDGVIDDMPTHAEIASRIITHREAVTRELSDLEKLGLLRKEGQRRAVVTDANRLAQMIGESVG